MQLNSYPGEINEYVSYDLCYQTNFYSWSS